MELVRREVQLRSRFERTAFERAFASFRETYNVAPVRALCSPDVLARFYEIFERCGTVHQHSAQVRFEDVPLVAAILAPGTLALEGLVDEERMGDW